MHVLSIHASRKSTNLQLIRPPRVDIRSRCRKLSAWTSHGAVCVARSCMCCTFKHVMSKCKSSQKIAIDNLQRTVTTMKFVLILLASALSMTQAARFGLLRVDSNGPKEKPATGEFGTRTLQKEDEVSYVYWPNHCFLFDITDSNSHSLFPKFTVPFVSSWDSWITARPCPCPCRK
jgi:hypothetical protein